MAIYLNSINPYENYKSLYRSKYFLDKSLIIDKLNEVIETSDKYICITRPRRFGKSSVADMIGTYYSILRNILMVVLLICLMNIHFLKTEALVSFLDLQKRKLRSFAKRIRK